LEGCRGPSSRRSLLSARVKRRVKDWLIWREFEFTLLIPDPFGLNFSSLTGFVVGGVWSTAMLTSLVGAGKCGLLEDLNAVSGMASHTGGQVIFLDVFRRGTETADLVATIVLFTKVPAVVAVGEVDLFLV